MPPIEKLIIMAFGALLAIIGVVLFARGTGKAEGTNKIKFAKLEFEFSAPSLFIFVVGCGLLVFPYFLGEGQRLMGSPTETNTAGSGLVANIAPTAADDSDATSAERQQSLEIRLADLQSRIDQAERSESLPKPTSTPPSRNQTTRTTNSITGQWSSATGSSYMLQQQGENVSIQEYTLGAVSAVGEGTFDGRNLDASVQTLMGEVDIDLDLSADGRRLSGELTYSLTGGVTRFEMYR